MKVKVPVIGGIAVSTQGRDKGKLYIITDVFNGRVYVSDGESKHILAPKPKNLKHLRLLPIQSALTDRLKNRVSGNVYNYEIKTELKRIATSIKNSAENENAEQNKSEE